MNLLLLIPSPTFLTNLAPHILEGLKTIMNLNFAKKVDQDQLNGPKLTQKKFAHLDTLKSISTLKIFGHFKSNDLTKIATRNLEI